MAETKGERITQKIDDIRDVNKGLKDQISYEKVINKLYADRDRFGKRQMDAVEDVLDKTKEIFQNRKELTNEQLTSVELHKLERRLIAEGLEDHIEIVQKLKQEHNIQKQINREVNAQAKVYDNIGSSIDGFIRKIPGIGGMLADVLGTGDLGKEMSEGFRTEMAKGGGFGEFGKNVGGEFGGNFLSGYFERENVSRAKDATKGFFSGGLTSAFAAAAVFAAAGGLFSRGMAQGFESMNVRNTFKRIIAGSAFDGLKDAFGNMGQANFRTLMSMRMNRLRFGVDEKDQAKILAAQVNISGATKDTALNIQKGIAESAAMRGVLPADVFQDIANNTENFAAFAKDGGQNIGEAAIRARELGISLDTVFKVSDGILDFQSSIENELKASLLIGRQLNLNEARRLAMAGDMAGLQEEILRQVGSEEELQRMNAIQRKSLAGALGVTVSELNRLASGELEVKNSDMVQNTAQMKSLTLVMGALAAAAATRLAVQGFSYGARLFKSGGVGFKETERLQKVMSAHNPSSLSYKQAAERLSQTQGRGFAVGTAGMFARGIGQLGILITAVSVITAVVNRIAGSSEKTAENTKRSVRETQFRTQNNMIHASVVSQESGRVAGTS